MSQVRRSRVGYDYALVRLVPRVHLGDSINVGVILQARTLDFLDLRLHWAPQAWSHRFPDLDVWMAERALRAYAKVCAGGAAGGPIGLLPPSERFHWLTAPRSAVVQTSAVHGGRSIDPVATLDALHASCIDRPLDSPSSPPE